jgi:diguanylate cyclase (GGDEF)-like protein/PAS domain S-box-containing protein
LATGIGKGFRIVCALLLILLAGVGSMVYQSTRHLIGMNHLVESSQVVLVKLAALQSALDEAISGTRAYSGSGSQADLDRVVSAETKAAEQLGLIRSLTADDPIQQKWIQQIEPQLVTTYRNWGDAVDLRTRGDSDAANRLLSSAVPEQLIREDRRTITEMVMQEDQVLGARSNQAEVSARHGFLIELLLAFAIFANLAVAYLFVQMDVNQKAKVLQAQQESEDKLRYLLESTAEGIYGIDSDGKCTFCNPACLQMLGYKKAEDLIGKDMHELCHHTKADGSAYPVKESRSHLAMEQGKGTHADDEVFWRADGSSFPAEYWSYPIRGGEQKIGVVVTFVDISERREAERKLGQVHDQLNIALRESQARARENAELSNLGDLFQSCQTVEEACTFAASALPRIFESRPGALCLTSASRSIVETAAVWNDCSSSEQSFAPDDCWALRRGKVHRVTDPKSALRCEHVTGSLPSGYLCVPLAAQGETLGVLYIADSTTGSNSSPESAGSGPEHLERLATAVGQRVSLALANLNMREVLRNQSIRDPLTGLFNRRYLEESLLRELRRAERKRRTVALVMLDLDHFKAFNDTFGHQAGDMLMGELGGVFKARVRAGDVACRYGGEEFALILAETDAKGAHACVETIREDIEHLHLHYRGQALGSVTISAGIAVFPEHADNPEDLIHAGDLALYRAKAEGRDRIVVAAKSLKETLVRNGSLS